MKSKTDQAYLIGIVCVLIIAIIVGLLSTAPKLGVRIDSVGTEYSVQWIAKYSRNKYDGNIEQWSQHISKRWIVKTTDNRLKYSEAENIADYTCGTPPKDAYLTKYIDRVVLKEFLSLYITSGNKRYYLNEMQYMAVRDKIGDSVLLEVDEFNKVINIKWLKNVK